MFSIMIGSILVGSVENNLVVDWSELPQEIIELIFKKLTICGDYIRFRCVCRSWNSSVPKTPLHLPPQLPWLMLSDNSFFDLSTNKIHHLNQIPHHSSICGSSHGWLVILVYIPQLTLFNPITHATISLPSLRNFPELIKRIFDYYSRRSLHRIKVVLSSNPSISDDFVAFAIFNGSNLAFCKKGYHSWVLLNVSGNHIWMDAVYKNGSFFVTSMDGTISVCDVEVPRVSFLYENAPDYNHYGICYALFAGDDMLLVQRCIVQDGDAPPERIRHWYAPDMLTVMFLIYKMNWNVLKWEELQTCFN